MRRGADGETLRVEVSTDMATQKRRTTQAGLGAVRAVTIHEGTEEPRATMKLPVAGRAARTTLPIPGDVEPLVEGRERAPSSVPASGRRAKGERAAIAVDDVGDAAVRLGSSPPMAARPKVVKTRRELEGAPLDPREAFLLSLVDGKMTVSSLVDVSGFAEADVLSMLARLRRLGIVAYA